MATLGDLYEAIDWSKVTESHLKWAAGGKSDPEMVDSEDFRRRFRLVLLEEALFSQDPTRKQEARFLLHSAGVWEQVVAYFRDHPELS